MTKSTHEGATPTFCRKKRRAAVTIGNICIFECDFNYPVVRAKMRSSYDCRWTQEGTGTVHLRGGPLSPVDPKLGSSSRWHFSGWRSVLLPPEVERMRMRERMSGQRAHDTSRCRESTLLCCAQVFFA